MADEQLRLEVSAQVDKFVADLRKATEEMNRMYHEGESLDTIMQTLDKRNTRVSGSMRDYSSSLKQTGTDTKTLNTTTAKTSKLMDTSSESIKGANASLISQRYALYDVASTYGVISAALLAVSTLAVKTASDFETAFTSVERTFDSSTTIDQMAGIRAELVNLSTQIPKTFAELAEVATLGNQLGIASKDIEDFTRVVTQFATITGVSAEKAALAFGQIANLANVDPSDFEALGSSIALVGVNSAATEDQIISVTKEIAKSASDAGFTTDQVVGLAGAISSLGIAPERARGSLDTYFGTLNRTVANGGEELALFAQIVGVTADELEKMVRAGQGEEVFAGFLRGLADLDNVDTTRALDALDLSQLRVANSLGRLANAQDLYNSTQADAAQGWSEEIELQRQFGLIVDDVASQIVILINSLNALIEQLTGGLVPGIAGAVGVLTEMVNWLREVSDNEATQWVAGFALTLVTLVGALTAFRAASALATASSYALVTAQASLAASSGGGAARGILGLIGIITGYTKVAADGTVATLGLRGAIVALGRATVVLALVGVAAQFLLDFNGSMATTLELVGPLTAAVNSVAYSFGSFIVSVGEALGWFGGVIANAGRQIQSLAAFGVQTSKEMSRWASDFRSAGESTDGFTESLSTVGTYTPDIQGLSGAFDNVGNSAKKAAAEVVTLKDYASDLGSVMSRAFEIRFGSQTAMDQVTSRWIDLNEEMEDYRRKVRELSADRKVTQYFLTVAEAYGDTLRAGVLRSELAEIDADLADATAGASTELKGNSKAAIENRATISGLVKGYQDYITELAASGASQAELNRAVERSQREFEAQATALGYTTKELQPYIKSFRDMKTVIDNVPRNITVKVTGLSAAEIAIKEFAAKTKKAIGKGFSVPVKMMADNSSVIRALEAQIRGEEARMLSLGWHQTSLVVPMQASIYSLRQQLRALRGYKEGGYTGGGGTSAPAGVVHGKEFVFNAQATKNAGVGNLYGMMRAFEQGRGYQNGGYVSPRTAPAMSNGPNVFVLDQAQYQGLVNSGNVVVQIGPEKVANAVNNTNQQYANLGRS